LAVQTTSFLIEPIKHKAPPQPVFPRQDHGRRAEGA
jgi:hypothetical protein